MSRFSYDALLRIPAQAIYRPIINESTIWLTAFGAVLWGLQLGVTQGLLGAIIADAAPYHLRGTAFAIYDVAIGVATFVASTGAGILWMSGRPIAAFGILVLLWE